jgi:hypothetical protein
MPGKDGTGPFGVGPRNGRGCCPCAGYPVLPYVGCGMGFGRGRDFRWMAQATGAPGMMRFGYPAAPATIGPTQEKALLENQAKILENQLEQVKDQLKRLEA